MLDRFRYSNLKSTPFAFFTAGNCSVLAITFIANASSLLQVSFNPADCISSHQLVTCTNSAQSPIRAYTHSSDLVAKSFTNASRSIRLYRSRYFVVTILSGCWDPNCCRAPSRWLLKGRLSKLVGARMSPVVVSTRLSPPCFVSSSAMASWN
uniref:(northern house mosquito) hypothetical protein n=1 Tax=Culex pipiens TaxID=7175 RepID=A0A8D8HP68_CULPI